MASIGDIIALLEVTLKTSKHLRGVRHATKEKEQFQGQIETLLSTLKGLRARDDSIDFENRQNVEKLVKQLQVLTNDLESQLHTSSNPLKAISQRLLWPLKKDEIKESFQKITEMIQYLQLETVVGDKLIRDAEDRKEFHVARVYCDQKTVETLDNHLDIVMSLWKQLADSVDFRLDDEDFKSLDAKLERIKFRSNIDERELKMGIFDKTIAQGGKVILILDGLDEVPETLQSKLIDDLKAIQGRNQQCLLLVSSRPYAHITEMSENDSKFNLEAKEIDIQLYVDDRISRKKQEFFKRPDIAGHIISSLTGRCTGNFLMAKLCMDEVLRATNEYDCKETIKSLPRSAQEAYDRGLDRLAILNSNRRTETPLPCHAIQALFWVAFALVPMTDRQLKQALAVDEGDEDYHITKETHLSIDTLCGELVIVDPSTRFVHSAHKTFTEHLMMDKTRERWFPDIREHIHLTLMRYLLLKCMREPADDAFGERYPLTEYAMQLWGDGLGKILKPKTQLWETTERLLKAPFDQWNEYLKHEAMDLMDSSIEGWDPDFESLGPGTISGLHWAVFFGLQCFVPLLLDYEKQNPITNPVSRTPLGLAAAQHKNDIARKLVENGAEINIVLSHDRPVRPPLYDAVDYENGELVFYLLEHGADMTLRRHDNNKSPLDIAYDRYNEDVTSILASFISGRVPTKAQELQFLVRGGFSTQLKKAINEGLDVNHPCENGKRALDYAYELGNQEIIDILEANHATPLLSWPAFKTESSPYPQNLPEPWGSGHVVTKQKLWDIDKCSLEYCRYDPDSDTEVKGDAESMNTDGEDKDSVLLLQVPVDSKLKLPLKSIVFETYSKHANGWGDETKNTTYLNSASSWYEVSVKHEQTKSQAFRIQNSVDVSNWFRLHTNIWNLKELEVYFPARAQFMKNIQHGDTLQVSAHAMGYKAINQIAFIRVRICGAE
ncbi:uncharacterized protein F4812DRAFT_450901 [Daldinia caldariorum]|uniref:uncharacterized protein n=1 Tax=Daldinia caldariorum TaxID=326644 RepID=UPI002007F46C|nr:uncharacterized protein F4812DRAFT_450901 [Daldinia caldariorum]KAI1468248.1 hypothetical protein F4812DRAFT_450901 [Daldinia caldariorum]